MPTSNFLLFRLIQMGIQNHTHAFETSLTISGKSHPVFKFSTAQILTIFY